MKRVVPICIFLMAVWIHAAEPAHVRVRLFSIEQPSEIRITNEVGKSTLIEARTLAAPFRIDAPVTIQRGKSDPVRVSHAVEVSVRNGTLVIVTEMPLEDYVAAVLAGESSNFRSDESLKAMAVAVRTYATHFFDRHKAEGFNFCDATHCQDLRMSALTDRFREAAADTRGKVLRYSGQPIPAFYHRDCGGVAEPGAPYLRQSADDFCTSRGRLQWTTELTATDLRTAIGVEGVHRIEVVEYTTSGRSRTLRISGPQNRTVDAEAFRLSIGRVLGWNKILSDLYEIRKSGESFIFEGYGAGHGIGMCQNGAAVMGQTGHSYRDILAYYYPNAAIGL